MYLNKPPNPLLPITLIKIIMKTIDITDIISQKLNSQATGALFFLDANKKLIQTYFVDGQMVSIKGCGVSGIEAVKELGSMKPIKFQFHEGAESRSKNELPETSVLLEVINNTQKAMNKTQLLNDDIASEVRELFMNHVGPIADVIFEEQVEKSHSAHDLIIGLSSYINNTDNRKVFIEKFT